MLARSLHTLVAMTSYVRLARRVLPRCADMNKRIPLGRLGKPEDLAGPVVFFLSDMSSYGAFSPISRRTDISLCGSSVTGAHLLVDGGLFVNLQ